MKLSILIPTMPKRIVLLNRLLNILVPQTNNLPIEIILDSARGICIGEKRNNLMMQATGEYVCFIDDDDLVSEDYIVKIMAGINIGVDCCSLNGLYKPDNAKEQTFIHSIKYDNFFEKDNILFRCPNHLNTIKREHAIKCPFPHWDRSEDSNFAFQLRDAGLLKTEHVIDGTIYIYEYVSDKRH